MPYKKFIACILVLFLSACSGARAVSNTVSTIIPSSSKSEGYFKVGNPYKIEGKRYIPRETYNYTETGIASWYGPNFHGKRTANGEVFDQNELTAAHRTLQLPSLVRVTNLENGRSLIVRVNDRGPFKRGRVIDLSRRSAELLGFIGKGTAKVKIQVLAEESRAIAEAAKRGHSTRGIEVAMNENRQEAVQQLSPAAGSPKAPPAQAQQPPPVYQQASAAPQNLTVPEVQSEALKTKEVSGHIRDGKFLPDPVVKNVPVGPSSIYVQVGAFGNQDNAKRLAAQLQSFGPANVYPAIVNGKQFFRVRLGPMPNVDQADTLLARLSDSGRDNAIIVVD